MFYLLSLSNASDSTIPIFYVSVTLVYCAYVTEISFKTCNVATGASLVAEIQ